jgi:phasin
MATIKKPVTKVIEETAETIVEQTVANTQAATAAVQTAAAELAKPFADMQEKVRANAEKGIEQLRSHYATLKGNAEAATDKLEESVTAAHAGTREFNMKVLDLFRTQTNAGFEHMQSLFGAKTVADAVKLQQDFAKSQVETLQAHSKHLAEIAKKVATDLVEPVKASMVMPFKR